MLTRESLERLTLAIATEGDPLLESALEVAASWQLAHSGWVGSGGMVKVIDLAGVLEAFVPLMTRRHASLGGGADGPVTLRIEASDQVATIRFWDECVSVDRIPDGRGIELAEQAMVRLLFGLATPEAPDRVGPALGRLLPLDFFVSPLEMV